MYIGQKLESNAEKFDQTVKMNSLGQVVKVQASLRICTDFHQPLLLNYLSPSFVYC